MSGIVTKSPTLNTNGIVASGVNPTTGFPDSVLINCKFGQYQSNQNKATGTIAVTGVGFAPNYIEVWCSYVGATGSIRAWGYASIFGTTISQGTVNFVADAAESFSTSRWCSTSDDTSGVDANRQDYVITAFGTDGFTMSNTKHGSPSTVHSFTYTAKLYGAKNN
jgi:hypothetical protein